MDKIKLINLYTSQKLSTIKIAKLFNCSPGKVYSYLKKYNIPTRNNSGKNNGMFGTHRVGELNPFWKKKHTQESKDKIRQHCIATDRWVGKNNPSFGGRSKEHQQRLTKARLARGSTNPYCNKKFLYQKYIKEQYSTQDIGKKIGASCATIFYWLQKFKIKIRHKNESSGRALAKKSKAFSGENNPAWIDGRSRDAYPPEWTNALKLKIRKRDNYKCQNCGMTEEEHLIVVGTALQVHHIDHDTQNCKETNLITTCQQCNIRANSNRGYWREFYTNKISEIYSVIGEI